ncbi:MAG: DUF3466 family protein [Planctomycetota bacterium]|nr:MAG: DUF3466 family protein [Planctomycetota bacterium]
MRHPLPLLLLAAAPGALRAQVSYDVSDLGSAAGTWSAAYAINESGQVAGETLVSPLDWNAFRWESGVMAVLPAPPGAGSSYGLSINSSGDVVGFDDVGRALVWSGGGVHVLPGLGGTYHGALAVNDAGQIVGRSTTASGDEHAFLWQAGALLDLGTLGGAYSAAYAINQAGQVAGGSGLAGGRQHSFLWENGQMRDLGTLGGRLATAYGINDNGLVAGGSWIAGPNLYEHAFLRNARGMVDLGTLQGPAGNSRALDVNNRGQVVGWSSYPGSVYPESHAFLYRDGVLHDLNDLIAPGSGWVLEAATSINDAGQIAGYGQFGAGPWRRAFLLEPAERVPALLDAAANELVLSGPVPGTAGTLNTFTATRATAGVLVWLAYGVHAGSGRVPGCARTTLGMRTPNTTPPQRADAAGVARFSVTVSASTAGRSVLFQAVEGVSCRVSNLITHTFP